MNIRCINFGCHFSSISNSRFSAKYLPQELRVPLFRANQLSQERRSRAIRTLGTSAAMYCTDMVVIVGIGALATSSAGIYLLSKILRRSRAGTALIEGTQSFLGLPHRWDPRWENVRALVNDMSPIDPRQRTSAYDNIGYVCIFQCYR